MRSEFDRPYSGDVAEVLVYDRVLNNDELTQVKNYLSGKYSVVFAEGQDGVEVFLRVFVGSQDGAIELRRSMTGPLADPRALGARLATLVLDELADSGLAMSRPPAHIPASPRERGATAERRALDPLPVTETPQ